MPSTTRRSGDDAAARGRRAQGAACAGPPQAGVAVGEDEAAVPTPAVPALAPARRRADGERAAVSPPLSVLGDGQRLRVGRVPGVHGAPPPGDDGLRRRSERGHLFDRCGTRRGAAWPRRRLRARAQRGGGDARPPPSQRRPGSRRRRRSRRRRAVWNDRVLGAGRDGCLVGGRGCSAGRRAVLGSRGSARRADGSQHRRLLQAERRLSRRREDRRRRRRGPSGARRARVPRSAIGIAAGRGAIGGEHPYLPRGTDADAGPWDVVLASRRLAIIDLSAAGHQPLCSPDGRAWIVHNGEIYNYVELRRELSALGHRFRGGSDTEVALAAYREWGADCFERFNGMWGMAIWDGERRRLVLSRDRFGVKPLYFADADQFVFASELKAILASGAVTPTENEAAVATFLETGRIDVRGGETSFAGVCQVEPGCYVVRSLDGAAAQRRYYDLVARVRPARATELLDVLEDAVALRLRSDVPVGSSLSGGVDSSAVVALAQRRLGQGLPMRTFTFASRAADDETEFA